MGLSQRIFLTGATGAMGLPTLHALLSSHPGQRQVVVLALPTPRDHAVLDPLAGTPGLEVRWGDLTRYADVEPCVREADLVMHVAALVSPTADSKPELAMRVNYGSARNIVRAIRELGQVSQTALVGISSVSLTGDRMPPIHWGRVGDPIKPSMFDYYTVSKVAAERLMIESGLARWVILRQTGLMGPAMAQVRDPIMFHNPLNNVLEYVSDRDAALMMCHLADYLLDGSLDPSFWRHIYNVGGGASCRASGLEMYRAAFAAAGVKRLEDVLSPRWMATRNFHGTYYLDSDVLENYLHFRHDSMDYFYSAFRRAAGAQGKVARILSRLPGGKRLVAAAARSMVEKIARQPRGTLDFLARNDQAAIDAYWGGRERWEQLPERLEDFQAFSDWDQVVHIDHGYDETKPAQELSLADVAGAARFRGGTLASPTMVTGDWGTPLEFTCAFGHTFHASPRLVLEGGHWCPVCERESWDYGRRAQVDPFFAQVWNPLHSPDEMRRYPKVVSELDVPDE